MKKDTIWITGAAGKLGKRLVKLLQEDTTNKVIATDMDVDITDMEAVHQHMDIYHPTVIINCASLSDMDYCEKNMVDAFKVNALGARNLAAESRRINAKIIQLSTDDVFSGKRPERLTEFDTPDPQSVYGKSKYAGENYVRELNPKHIIIRSSWVYGQGKGDYFSYVIEKAKANESFEAPLNRISTPTSAGELAHFILTLLQRSEYGVFHASCEGAASRHEFARTILALAGYDPTLAVGAFEGTETSSTLLENLMLKMTDIYEMPHWQTALKEHIENWKKED